MKRRTVGWLLAALALLGLVLLLGYFLRPTANPRSPKATAERVQDQIELAPSDLLTLESRELTQGLPISGTIKAMQSALSEFPWATTMVVSPRITLGKISVQ